MWTIIVLCLNLCLLTTNTHHYTISRILKRQAGWHGETISVSPEAFVVPALLLLVLLVLSLEWKANDLANRNNSRFTGVPSWLESEAASRLLPRLIFRKSAP
jgi:hypothetical protein